jgi:hypothetical protein
MTTCIVPYSAHNALEDAAALSAIVELDPMYNSALSVFTFGGSGPALTAHGSLDLKQEIEIQIQTPPSDFYLAYNTFRILRS